MFLLSRLPEDHAIFEFFIFFIEKLSITEALNERFKNNYFRAFMIFFFLHFLYLSLQIHQKPFHDQLIIVVP